MRLMTDNVWNRDENLPEWEAKGNDCSAAARIGGLVLVYLDTQPDIIGGQEVSALVADLLKEHCHRVRREKCGLPRLHQNRLRPLL